MNKLLIGKVILTVVLVATSVVSTAVDINSTHLFNPLWHAHAVFHDALMLLFLAGMTITALWLLWRKNSEPEIGLKVALLVPLTFWTPFYYITTLLPKSSLNAFDEQLPTFLGITLYPNIAVATVLLILAIGGYRIARSA